MAVKIQTGYLPVEIDLWGAVYETRDLTTAESATETELLAEALASEEAEDAIKAYAKYLDLILSPVNGATKASTALKREFKAGKITARGVFGVVSQIKAAEQGEQAKILQRLASGRPT